MEEKVLKSIEVRLTTRESCWAEIYTAAVSVGFSPELAASQTDQVVNLIFGHIGPQKEAELRVLREVPSPGKNALEDQPGAFKRAFKLS